MKVAKNKMCRLWRDWGLIAILWGGKTTVFTYSELVSTITTSKTLGAVLRSILYLPWEGLQLILHRGKIVIPIHTLVEAQYQKTVRTYLHD